ncbi:phosphatase PAP2 family protein [Rhodococcus spelaei]|uniref:Phosphatase PAP2 family protein n=2 Tax=Rhodococcus spelaei TaxID=2546320 RepID=A0A541BPU8_9NOCA|nr:phosphatase PAP2 family protein [Rhodococcus spelaei]
MLRIRTPWLTDVVTVVTDLGGTLVSWVITAAVAVALLVRRHPREAELVVGAMLSGLLVMNGLKLLFGRERPPIPERLVDEATHSFPSGHAMMSAILVCVVGAALVRVLGPRARNPVIFGLLALWTVAVGLSRVYLGAHWLTDVLAGWVFGAVWAALWIWGVSRFGSRGRKSGESVAE